MFLLGKTTHEMIYVSRRQSMVAFQCHSYNSAAACSREGSSCSCQGRSVGAGDTGPLVVVNALLPPQQPRYKRNKPGALGCSGMHALLSCGLSFRRVFKPTRIPSCIVRILTGMRLPYSHSLSVTNIHNNVPMSHQHALLSAQENLLTALACNASIHRLGIC